MDQQEWLAERFEENRTHLRAVAYRMLGSLSEADDAVQESCSGRARFAQPALVNGAVGAVRAPGGRPRVVFGFTITRGKIVEIDLVADRERLRQLDLAILND
jgi:hypothetical protein